jgi:cytoskeletal protein RodZ
MKPNLYHILFSFLALFLTQTSLFAQDAPDYNHPNSYEHDASTYTYSDSEVKNGSSSKAGAATTARDSVAAVRMAQRVRPALPEGTGTKGEASKQPQAPAQAAPAAGQGNSEDDSILSFNFLYYIIQKFKMQDIIE